MITFGDSGRTNGCSHCLWWIIRSWSFDYFCVRFHTNPVSMIAPLHSLRPATLPVECAGGLARPCFPASADTARGWHEPKCQHLADTPAPEGQFGSHCRCPLPIALRQTLPASLDRLRQHHT